MWQRVDRFCSAVGWGACVTFEGAMYGLVNHKEKEWEIRVLLLCTQLAVWKVRCLLVQKGLFFTRQECG